MKRPDNESNRTGILILIFIGLALICHGQSTASNKLTLLFAGDIMGHIEQVWSAENRKNHTYNYDTVFSFIKPVISEADIAIANLEVTLAGPPYSGFPSFNSPAALAVACKNAGIDCLVTANNHAADRRANGIKKTIHILDSLGIAHTGTFLSKEHRDKTYPLMLEKNGISIAVLNYTYGTNGNRVNYPVIVNTIDKEIIENDFYDAREKRPDFIIVFLHWGIENKTVPSKYQYELAEYLSDQGADLIIGSHPHVLQNMIWVKDSDAGKASAIYYSLGNFISNQRREKTDGGAIARVEITKNNSSVYITHADYYLTWVYTPIEKYRKRFFVMPCSEYENRESFFTDTLQYRKMKKFMNESRALLYLQNKNVYEMIYNGTSWLLNY
jgi:poly-gamma-glutamate capsule biosynthesis protein CapA/YwtB (metallophosphatase superfamily)